MTKHEFCRQIVQTVDNCRSIDGSSDDEIATVIAAVISPLAPKDLKKFAAWGTPEHQATPEECW